MDVRRHAPAAQRNREPILAVLRRVLPTSGVVLEVASGTGEHAVYFAPALAPRTWQPSDPDPGQRASIAAWGDERHVEENRRRYAAKRAIFLELFARYGVHIAGSEGTFYLWVAVPDERPSLAWALELLDRADVVVAPGSFFGPEGEGYVRMAMVPTRAECERAARSLEGVLQGGRA